jgi:hypothetical protein
MTTTMLHLIIRGTWRTPSHSNDRSKDDTHKVKEQILKEVGKVIYEKKVGKNPDLDICPKTKKIILKGRKNYSKKICETELNAGDYFVQCFLLTKKYPHYFYMRGRCEKYSNCYMIPPDMDMLSLLLDHIFKQENFQEFYIDIVI